MAGHDMKFDFESIKAWFSDRFNRYRIIIIAVALLAALGFALWFFGAIDAWWFNRGVNKDQEAIKAKGDEANKALANVANLQIQLEGAKVEANTAVNSYVNAVNATDKVKEVTNQALANLNAAKNANVTNTSVEQLQDLLDKLDQ